MKRRRAHGALGSIHKFSTVSTIAASSFSYEPKAIIVIIFFCIHAATTIVATAAVPNVFPGAFFKAQQFSRHLQKCSWLSTFP